MMDEFVKKLAEIPEVKLVILFGSRARGDAGPDSDYDIAVFLERPNTSIETQIFSTAPKNVDLVFFHRTPLYVKARILREGKILVNKDDNLLKSITLKTMTDYLDNKDLYSEVY